MSTLFEGLSVLQTGEGGTTRMYMPLRPDFVSGVSAYPSIACLLKAEYEGTVGLVIAISDGTQPQYPARTCPCQRFVDLLTDTGHDSETEWVASPSLHRTFTNYTPLAFDGAFQNQIPQIEGVAGLATFVRRTKPSIDKMPRNRPGVFPNKFAK